MAIAQDNSAGFRYPGTCLVTVGTGIFVIAMGAGGNAGVTSAVPFTWADADKLYIYIRTETA